MRWVSRAFFFFPYLKMPVLLHYKGERCARGESGSFRLERAGAGDKSLIGGERVEALLVGLVSGEALAAAAFF